MIEVKRMKKEQSEEMQKIRKLEEEINNLIHEFEDDTELSVVDVIILGSDFLPPYRTIAIKTKIK